MKQLDLLDEGNAENVIKILNDINDYGQMKSLDR